MVKQNQRQNKNQNGKKKSREREKKNQFNIPAENCLCLVQLRRFIFRDLRTTKRTHLSEFVHFTR